MSHCTCQAHKGNPSPAPAAEKRLRAIVGELLKLQGDDVIARLGRLMRGDPLEKGGPGSGHFGHSGRPGEVGGSSDEGEGFDSDRMEETRATLRRITSGGIFDPVFLDGQQLTREQRDGAVAIGYPTRDATEEDLRLFQKMQDEAGLPAALTAYGSMETWYQSPTKALTEWDAAERISGNNEQSKEIAHLLSGEREGYREPYARMEEKTVGAFRVRMEAAQEAFRKVHGDGEIEVFRGVSGAQAKLIKKKVQGEEGKTFELNFRPLSSWTLSKYDAGDFAGPNGVVFSSKIRASDVWMMTGVGNRGVIRFLEDSSEIVTVNRSSIRSVKYEGAGHRAVNRTGGVLGWQKSMLPEETVPIYIDDEDEWMASWVARKRSGQKSLSLKSTTPPLLSPKWDERVVRATMPLLLGVFKAGGDEALGQIRRFPRSAKGMAWFPPSMTKASEYLSFDDFMDRYMADSPVSIASWIDQPEVVQAAERGAYQFAQQINQTTADALREVIVMGMENGDDIKTIANSISNLSDEWAEGWRAEMIARTETARVYTSGRIEAWRATGVVQRKVWSAADDACPFCQELDGTVVDLDKPFFKVGEAAQATWNGEEILMDIDYMDVDGPPLHPNCRCAIVGELDYEALDRGGETLEEILAGDVSKSVKAKNDDGEDGRWVTMRGRRVFIREGQDPADALQESLSRQRPDTPARFHPGPDKEHPGKGGKWTLEDGKPLPDHVPKNIPPAWTDVKVSMDPEAPMVVTGRDAAGRSQRRYLKTVADENKAAKFARTSELLQKKESILKENDSLLAKPDTAEEALVTKLIFATGLRPGSSKNTKAEKQAYGATTLLAEHVKKSGDGVVLSFVGKSGKDLTIPVEDRSMAKVLLDRRARGGKLFGTSEARVLEHVSKLDGGGFKTKDIRTAVGTETALKAIKQMPAPDSEKAYRKAVMAVAGTVSAKLGNTPTVALQSYIDPAVFAPWQQAWGGKKLVAAKSYQGFDKNTEVQFGDVEALPDWRKVRIVDDEDPDDEELEQTPQGVVEMLGFDPLEFEQEEPTSEKGGPGSGHFGHSGRPGEVGGSSDEGSGFVLEKLEMMNDDSISTTNNSALHKEWERPEREQMLERHRMDAIKESIGQLIAERSSEPDPDKKKEITEHIHELSEEYNAFPSIPSLSSFTKDQNVRSIAARIPASVDVSPLADFNLSGRYTTDGTMDRDTFVKNVTDMILSTWAESASDTNPRSLEIQKAIAEEFKLDSKWVDKALASVGYKDGLTSTGRQERVAALRPFIRAMYENTQERLASAGIKKITGFRGFNDEDGIFEGAKIPFTGEGKKGEGLRIITNPASSWSSNLRVAKDFAEQGDNGLIFKASIPSSRVLSLATTGMGCLREQEVVTLGSNDWVTTWRHEKE